MQRLISKGGINILNNLIKLLLDTNRLCLDSVEYDKSIPVETNPELNELEIKLRKELAYIHAMELRQGNIYLESDRFEPRISNKFANKIVFRAFPIIHKDSLLYGLPFKWDNTRNYDPYFFKYKGAPSKSLIEQAFMGPYVIPYVVDCFSGRMGEDPNDIENLYN